MIGDEKYTAEQVRTMLDKAMIAFRSGMIQIIREAAFHKDYRDQTAHDALIMVADRLEDLK